MAKKRRKLPKDETKNFLLKSNMKSWANKSKGHIREQESTIAKFERKLPPVMSKLDRQTTTNLKKVISGNEIRRDDSDIGIIAELIPTNKATCFQLVKFLTMLRKDSFPKNKSNIRWLKFLITEYVKTVREIGNFCLDCGNPIRHKIAYIENDFIVDYIEISFKDGKLIKGKEVAFVDNSESREQKRDRQTIRKTASVTDKKTKLPKSKMFFMEASKIGYKKKGKTVYYATIFDSKELFLILDRETNSILSAEDFRVNKSVHFVKFDKRTENFKMICRCKPKRVI